MKRSVKPSEFVLLRCQNNSEWDDCGFVLFQVNKEWEEMMLKRLEKLRSFENEPFFYCHSYWDAPIGYFKSPEEMYGSLVDEILEKSEDWCFVELETGEPDCFPLPENRLEAHQMIIHLSGDAHYKAYGKHTGEEFWTESFSIQAVLAALKE